MTITAKYPGKCACGTVRPGRSFDGVIYEAKQRRGQEPLTQDRRIVALNAVEETLATHRPLIKSELRGIDSILADARAMLPGPAQRALGPYTEKLFEAREAYLAALAAAQHAVDRAATEVAMELVKAKPAHAPGEE